MASEPIDLGVLLGLAFGDFVVGLTAHLAARGFGGIRPSFGSVFRALAADELTASQLAPRLGITAAGAGKLVDAMVAERYVERVAHPDDARSWRLRLGKRGWQALAEARRYHRQCERRLVAAHGPRAVASLRALLGDLIADGGGEVRLLKQI